MPRGMRAERDKGDAGAEQRAHEPKERAARRFAGKGEPPEVSGAAKDAPSSTSPAIMGTAASSKSIPARSKMEALVVQASRNGSTTAPEVRVGFPQGSMPRRSARRSAPQGQAPREAQKQPCVARQCQRYLTSGAHLQRGVQRARQQRAQRQPEIAAKADFHHQRFRGIECHGPLLSL